MPDSKIDISQFQLALRAYKAATNKDATEVINRAARNIAYRAASFTNKGTANKIRNDIMSDSHLRYALTSLALKKRGIGRLPAPQFQKEVDRFVSRRASSAGYLRSGWAAAIQALGGSFRGAQFKGAGGFANKAVVSRLICEIVNTTSHKTQASVRGAELIGTEAVRKAVAFVSEDMINYAKQLMGVTARKYSA